jgi:poly(hydroxyalkanoate) depolymerase family esterase
MRASRALAALGLAMVFAATSAPHAVATARWQGRFLGPYTLRGGTSGGNTWPSRDYYVFVPKRLATPSHRALVVYLHGTTQTAKIAALGARWNDVADEDGFLVAYPEERTESSNADGANAARAWPWGRAAYENRDQGEFKTIAEITRTVARKYKVSPRRVYIAGISAGAIMAAAQAATYPDLYAAYASWAGCAYICADPTGELGYQRMGKFRRVVPAILFAATADYLVPLPLTSTQVTGWTRMNDLADDGEANGSVSQMPTYGPTTYGGDPASLQPSPNTGPSDGSRGDLGTCLYASRPKGNNPCAGGPLGWRSYPYTVTRFGYAASPRNVVVESWYIHGPSHNYWNGSTDGNYADPLGPDTTHAAWDFFRTHPR